MKLLKERILEEGRVLPGNILKVDSFLNHRVDPLLFQEMAKEFRKRFGVEEIDKVLTIEVSGIAPAYAVALEYGVPMVFGKKTDSKTLGDECYTTEIHSFTKGNSYTAKMDSHLLNEGDRVLLIDDFLANGRALTGLIDLAEQANAEILGIGICIEKSFQKGGDLIRKTGYPLESLARIKSLENETVEFL